MIKLRTQLSAGFALIVLVTIALISLVSNVFITRQFEKYVASQQIIAADDLAKGLAYPFDPGSETWNQEYIPPQIFSCMPETETPTSIGWRKRWR